MAQNNKANLLLTNCTTPQVDPAISTWLLDRYFFIISLKIEVESRLNRCRSQTLFRPRTAECKESSKVLSVKSSPLPPFIILFVSYFFQQVVGACDSCNMHYSSRFFSIYLFLFETANITPRWKHFTNLQNNPFQKKIH